MNKLFITLFILFLTSCIQGSITPQLRALFSSNSNLPIVSIDSIKSVDELNRIICNESGKVGIYFNFVNGNFSNATSNQSIPLNVLGLNCKDGIQYVTPINIIQVDGGFLIDSKDGDIEQLSTLIMEHHLNLGVDPGLSESPTALVIEIKSMDGDVQATAPIVKVVIESYLNSLKEQQLFEANGKDVDWQIKVGQDYPLNLKFR
jgi:hypothetical protein